MTDGNLLTGFHCLIDEAASGIETPLELARRHFQPVLRYWRCFADMIRVSAVTAGRKTLIMLIKVQRSCKKNKEQQEGEGNAF